MLSEIQVLIIILMFLNPDLIRCVDLDPTGSGSTQSPASVIRVMSCRSVFREIAGHYPEAAGGADQPQL